MESRIAQALKLKYQPVGVVWTDDKPEAAIQFQPGRWGCVMAAFGATLGRGKPAVFDRSTYGCWGGGVGLGFGNVYTEFPGGVDCFCRFLADGNESDPKGAAVAEACAGWMRGEMREDFLHGERYRKTPELVAQSLNDLPIADVPSKYAVFRPLSGFFGQDKPAIVVFMANADQISALVVLANHGRGDNENVIIPFAAGCQTAFLYPLREAGRERPRAVVGLNDLSARRVLRKFGRDMMTFSAPYALFEEMESNLEGSFLGKQLWQQFLGE